MAHTVLVLSRRAHAKGVIRTEDQPVSVAHKSAYGVGESLHIISPQQAYF
jgi:hypothetical protein